MNVKINKYLEKYTFSAYKSVFIFLLIGLTVLLRTSVEAKEKTQKDLKVSSKPKLSIGLNKGASFSDDSEKKVSNWSSIYHKRYMDELGIKNAALHYNINLQSSRKDPLNWIYTNYINKGIDTTVTLLLKINKDDPDYIKKKAKEEGFHSVILDGYYDKQLIKIGNKIRNNKRMIRLSLLHEGNGGWYEWGMCAKGNTQNSLIKSLRHTINQIDSTGASKYIKYDFNLNRTGCDGPMKNANQYLPQITEIVDRISVSTYNRCGTASRYKEEKQFASEFLPPYLTIAKYTKKPIYIAETATSGLCGDRLQWYKSLFKSLHKFPQLTGINFFFGDVPVGVASNDVPIRWGLNNEREKKGFKAIISKYTIDKKDRNNLMKNNNTFLDFKSMPWSVWMEVANEFSGPKTSMGKKDFTILTNASQRFYWGDEGSFQHGPGIGIVGAFSSNKKRWWSHQIFPQLTYNMVLGGVTRYLGQWDASRLELYVGYRQYYEHTPKASQGIESGVRFLFIFGGDRLKDD